MILEDNIRAASSTFDFSLARLIEKIDLRPSFNAIAKGSKCSLGLFWLLVMEIIYIEDMEQRCGLFDQGNI